MARRGRPARGDDANRRGSTGVDDESLSDAIRRRIQTIGRPGEVVLVASRRRRGSRRHRARTRAGRSRRAATADGPGTSPSTDSAAVNHLEAQRTRGARYFVLPEAGVQLALPLPGAVRAPRARVPARAPGRVPRRCTTSPADAADECALDPTPPAAGAGRRHVRRAPHRPAARPAHRARHRARTSPSNSTGARRPRRPEASPRSRPTHDADFVVYVRDDAILPSRFLDTLIATQATLDVDRVQPAHTGGPGGGPPVTERHLGTVAREIDDVTALPVLSVRARRRRDRAGDAHRQRHASGCAAPLLPRDRCTGRRVRAPGVGARRRPPPGRVRAPGAARSRRASAC